MPRPVCLARTQGRPLVPTGRSATRGSFRYVPRGAPRYVSYACGAATGEDAQDGQAAMGVHSPGSGMCERRHRARAPALEPAGRAPYRRGKSRGLRATMIPSVRRAQRQPTAGRVRRPGRSAGYWEPVGSTPGSAHCTQCAYCGVSPARPGRPGAEFPAHPVTAAEPHAPAPGAGSRSRGPVEAQEPAHAVPLHVLRPRQQRQPHAS